MTTVKYEQQRTILDAIRRRDLDLDRDALQDHSRQTAELFVRARVCAVTQLPKKSPQHFQTFIHALYIQPEITTKNTLFGPENTIFRPKNRQKTYT